MQAIFVTGTDTGIGKTLVSAWLVHHWRAAYWKPIQTGALEDSDSATIAALAPGAAITPPTCLFRAPLSPRDAARAEGARVDPALLLPPRVAGPLVIEGAGGILVPLTDDILTVDFAHRLGCPVLVVARSGLGTINHTLLTLEALAARGVPVLGVVMNGPPDAGNRTAIEHFGKVRVLAEIPPLARADADAIAALPPPTFPCPKGTPR